MFQAYAEMKVNDHWKGHVLWENVNPGSFYRAQDFGYFLRFEVSYQFVAKLPLKRS